MNERIDKLKKIYDQWAPEQAPQLRAPFLLGGFVIYEIVF